MSNVEKIKLDIEGKLKRHYGRTIKTATKDQIYKAVSYSIRDSFVDLWIDANHEVEDREMKRLYYMSAEFLMGRALTNNLINTGKYDEYKAALLEFGIELDEIEERENDAALGNGGLGRLAACFLDSLSTLNFPATGCGIMYEYGLFRQRILDGEQVEVPDNWIDSGHVWQIERPEEQFEVHYDGEIEEVWTPQGLKISHKNYHSVYAVPYDMPIVGYETNLPATLRLWSARAANRLDLTQFNRGDYVHAMAERELAEVISKVLYPEDHHEQGRQLRLKQFYFLVSATMQSIVRNHKTKYGDLRSLPDKICVQINDTHPTLSIPELIRILMDQEGFTWEEASDIAKRTFNYTNHTIMIEALECWAEPMFKSLLPRIYSIVHQINEDFCKKLWNFYPDEWDKISRMAVIAYGEIRMANLCLAVCGNVNGVSQLHGEILKTDTFKDFYLVDPDKYLGITNGITPRRWLALSNPDLNALLNETIGPGFMKDWKHLSKLEEFLDDSAFLEKFDKVKQKNKQIFAKYVYDSQGIKINENTIFDVQAKRLHEYKRQLLKVIHILHLYNQIISGENYNIPPTTFIFAAKASPGYAKAKNIIRLINMVGKLVNEDVRTRDKLSVVFLENYCVSSAQVLVPAAEISEQISTAGREASGTGNMKFMLNGAVTIGTLDGANVEIFEQVGRDNIFIFGARVDEIRYMEKYNTYHPGEYFERDSALRNALSRLIDNTLPVSDNRRFSDIYHSLLFGDYNRADAYYLLYDFQSYNRAFMRIAKAYEDRKKWNRIAAVNTAKAGIFSSDRTIQEYNDLIWHLTPFEEGPFDCNRIF